MATKTLKLTHPGRILREEFMESVGLSGYALAKSLNVPLPRVNDIVRERRAISPEMAVLLSAYFGTTDGYWINLQAHYDLEMARERVGKQASRIHPHPHDARGALQPVRAKTGSTGRIAEVRGKKDVAAPSTQARRRKGRIAVA